MDLPIGGYDYVITDGCGRTHTSFTNISDKPEFGANIIFSGKVVNDIPSKDLRTFVDNIKKQNKNVIAVLL